MRTYSTNEARNKFAEVIDIARREPIAITKNGRIVSVLLAKEDYEYYQVLNEERWMNYQTVPAEDLTKQINAKIEKLERKLC